MKKIKFISINLKFEKNISEILKASIYKIENFLVLNNFVVKEKSVFRILSLKIIFFK